MRFHRRIGADRTRRSRTSRACSDIYLERELESLGKEGVRLQLLGDYHAFGADLVKRLERAMDKLKSNDRITLVVALNYGSRAEIAQAAQKLATQGRCR